jgi:hypothetical protein
MKHYILLSVTVPGYDENEKLAQWQSLQQRLAGRAKTTKDIEVLAENTWLIPRAQGMPFLAECVALASRHGIEHRIWFLDGELEKIAAA